jgi:hypothetical protein
MPAGDAPLSDARFRHDWRPYQARILAALDEHLDDHRLHVIAPPGSGKTVLGLEVVRRRAAPALVLAPTTTVREQWLQRFRDDFVGSELVAVSRDPGRPADITVCTYQALHSRCKDDAHLARSLARRGVRTIVVDEAHHLRRAWWRSMEDVVGSLRSSSGLTLVALTATPPYDAPAVEWNRYRSFCGPVDEEIAVPELVADANLCPHQDLVWLVAPDEQAEASLRRFRDEVDKTVRDLCLDLELAEDLGRDPRVAKPNDEVDALLGSDHAFLAAAVFLGNVQWEAARPLLAALDLEKVALPVVDRLWAERLLQGIASGVFELTPERRRHWLQRLTEIGAFEHGRVSLMASPEQARSLGGSPAKIDAVCDIVELESRLNPLELRLVVLTDYIRQAALGTSGTTRLGVVPLFEAIRRRRMERVRPAILTGRLVVLPASAVDALDGPGAEEWSWSRLEHDPNFVRLDQEPDHHVTRAVTSLFERGVVSVLVGSSALLGEGWDAPAVSTLVLATTVGAHVTSNQLRGRAIRSEPGNPLKVANIWHVACVPIMEHAGGEGELDRLARRFEAFVGLVHDRDALESGIGRLGVPSTESLHRDEIGTINRSMRHAAEGRDRLAERWSHSLGGGDRRSSELRREIRVPLRSRRLSLMVGDAGRSPWWVPAWLATWWERRTLEGIARAVAQGMEEGGFIAQGAAAQVVCEVGREGLAVGLGGASYLDQGRFTSTFEELLDFLASPRYLILCSGQPWAVPASFGGNREHAERLSRAWRRHVGRHRLVYTRHGEGRRTLLLAKQASLLRAEPLRMRARMRWVVAEG